VKKVKTLHKEGRLRTLFAKEGRKGTATHLARNAKGSKRRIIGDQRGGVIDGPQMISDGIKTAERSCELKLGGLKGLRRRYKLTEGKTRERTPEQTSED